MKTFIIIFCLILVETMYAITFQRENKYSPESFFISKLNESEYKLTGNLNFINWTGSKPAGKHYGNLFIAEGSIFITGDRVTTGSIKFDMNSIKNLDIENPQSNERLVKHLKSPDFFDVENFPIASFEIVSVKPIKSSSNPKEGEIPTNTEVTGNLTIKGIAKTIVFPALISIEKNTVIVSTNPFLINRTWWGVNYQSKSIFAELKDRFIFDEIILSFNLKFSKI